MEALGKCKCFTKFRYSSLPRARQDHLTLGAVAPSTGGRSTPTCAQALAPDQCHLWQEGSSPSSLEHLLLGQVSIVPRRSGQSGWAAMEGTAETLGMAMHFMGTPVAADAVSCQWHPPPPARSLSLAQFSASESWGDLLRNSPSERSLSKQQCLGPCRFTNGL